MKRALVIEKRNDYLRQYWMTNELDWPDDPVTIQAIVNELSRIGIINVIKYSPNAKLVPWLYTIDLFDKNELPLPAKLVFPYPMADITNEAELAGYNNWLMTDFAKHVMKMNNSISVEPGWENITHKFVCRFEPVKLIIQEYELSRAETFASYAISENSCIE